MGPAPAAAELPIVAGVVRVSRVTTSIEGRPEPAQLSAPADAPADAAPADAAPVEPGTGDVPAADEPAVTTAGAAAPEPGVEPLKAATSTWRTGTWSAAPLVDGIPDFSASPVPAVAPPAPSVPAPVPAGATPPSDESYDHLFGDTIHRSLDDAAVREPTAVDQETAGPRRDTDHDGATVMRADLRAGRAAADRPAEGVPTVLGIACSCGRANPPHSRTCARCANPLPDVDPVALPRPVLGMLRASDGGLAPVDRTALIGRSPTASRFSSDDAQHILRVGAEAQNISRNHAEVRVEEWDVLVVDRSSNGTWLCRPGIEPQKLHKDEPVPVFPGSVIDLGDGITLDFEAAGS